MHSNFISKLLGLKDVKVKNISHSDTLLKITLETKPTPTVCPCCGGVTSKVHDYRFQKIKDFPYMNKSVLLILRKRRYICSCGKKFYEHYDFLPRYHRMTNRLSAYIISELSHSVSVSFVASKANVSPTTVNRIFNHVCYSRPSTLPKALAIDEFKGNAGGEKYQCILVDPKKKRILDILPDRKQQHLIDYFKRFSRHERLKVQFFICDMWNQYAQLARTFFPNALIIVDKYHFTRQVTWAVEDVRKRVQKTMTPELRRYFKRSRTLILKRAKNLTEAETERLNIMLLYNDDLRQAYRLKETFYAICHEPKYAQQRTDFYEWIAYAESQNIKEFQACITAFRNWSKEILNAFKYGYTNGCTEGYNNKIKVLKRISYGVRNFNRFRNRILHTCQ